MTPQDVIRSCHVLLQHLQSQRSAAEKALRDWEKSIEDRELIEKRRVAPGYLDTGIQLLKPTRVGGGGGGEVESVMDMDEVQDQRSKEAGEELDRVFGRA